VGVIGIAIVIFVYVLMVLIDRDIIKANYSKTLAKPAKSNPYISLDSNEQIKSHISGVNKTGSEIVSPFKRFGVTTTDNPENAIIITNKRLDFIYVPLAGANQNINGFNINAVDSLLAQPDIEKELTSMLNTMTLLEILNSSPYNFSINFTDIIKVMTSDFEHEITFQTRDKQNYSYRINNKDDFIKLKGMFVTSTNILSGIV
jgi:hypothetical protein